MKEYESFAFKFSRKHAETFQFLSEEMLSDVSYIPVDFVRAITVVELQRKGSQTHFH